MRMNLYGLMAEFETPEQLMEAAHRVRQEGYKRVDAFTPFPVHGLTEALGIHNNPVPWIVFTCGAIGALFGFFILQSYTAVVDYPMNVGGRPYISWPSFIPITFECMILSAAFGALFGMLAVNGLPRPYHPVFNVPEFDRCSNDRFFIVIESEDPKFDATSTKAFLQSIGSVSVAEVRP